MKKWLPWILVATFALYTLSGLRAPKPKDGFELAEFGRLPVLLNGRVQPFDSVARNALLSMSGKSDVRLDDGKKMSATEWLLEAMTRPNDADTRRIFRAQHPELESMLGTEKAGLEYYSFNQITNQLEEVEKQARNIMKSEEGKEGASQTRTPFQKDVIHFYDSLILFHRIKNSLGPEGSKDLAHELKVYREAIGPGLDALRANEAGEDHDQDDLQALIAFFKRYENISKYAYPRVVPPLKDEPREKWENIGGSLKEAMRSGEVHPAAGHLAAIGTAYTKSQPTEFNKAIADYKVWLQSNNLLPEMKKGREEFSFNHAQLFYKSLSIYVVALILGCAFWINLSEPVRRSAFWLVILAFIIHTIGLGFRMYLENRPPVTNLYSSAIFVGWGAVLLGMILERIYKAAIGLVTAAFVGFVTLIIAHHLSLSGDTMEMLRAVLDTNFWLATHVVCITVGYSAMFIAGFLAIVYILRGFFTKSLTPDIARALTRMVYGIICFATLFSFVGTILGGIWADQSWGRFWGWDPKENGALLIVISNAIALHARWGGLVRERGLMALAVFGNIVTSFSWFGVNMLGVGLHSYGFMDKAFFWLMLFISSQVLIIAIGMLPLRSWASFRDSTPSSAGKPPTPPVPAEASV